MQRLIYLEFVVRTSVLLIIRKNRSILKINQGSIVRAIAFISGLPVPRSPIPPFPIFLFQLFPPHPFVRKNHNFNHQTNDRKELFFT